MKQIEPKELRIGNYLYSKNSNCLFEKGLVVVDLNVFEKIRMYNGLSCLNPYELTEGRLFDLGLYKFKDEKGTYFSFYEDNIFKIRFIDDIDTLKAFKCYIGNQYIRRLDYIHQLQNLWYELSGVDLKRPK